MSIIYLFLVWKISRLMYSWNLFLIEKKNFELTDEGNIDKYLGVNIKIGKDNSHEIWQLYLIQQTVE